MPSTGEEPSRTATPAQQAEQRLAELEARRQALLTAARSDLARAQSTAPSRGASGPGRLLGAFAGIEVHEREITTPAGSAPVKDARAIAGSVQEIGRARVTTALEHAYTAAGRKPPYFFPADADLFLVVETVSHSVARPLTAEQLPPALSFAAHVNEVAAWAAGRTELNAADAAAADVAAARAHLERVEQEHSLPAAIEAARADLDRLREQPEVSAPAQLPMDKMRTDVTERVEDLLEPGERAHFIVRLRFRHYLIGTDLRLMAVRATRREAAIEDDWIYSDGVDVRLAISRLRGPRLSIAQPWLRRKAQIPVRRKRLREFEAIVGNVAENLYRIQHAIAPERWAAVLYDEPPTPH